MAKTKTRGPLSVTKATADARRIVNRTLPAMGPEVSVTSKLSHDLTADRAIVVTTITFPPSVSKQDVADMDDDLHTLPGWFDAAIDPTRITVTRFR
jgi:hypothetical protein